MTSSTEIQPTPIFVGTMAFCPHCGNLMDPPSKNPVSTCGSCGYAYKLEGKNFLKFNNSLDSKASLSLALLVLLEAQVTYTCFISSNSP
ncbi:DNA-directed RNA polymerase I core subunit rpa12, variant 2 [Entomophthora muscae]|uniref:DNA-directed RNA polymerase I core subunit rpa12, variant 2 n=1 Tax=Entomophthora muscae TaxID=34485 RepID=A0ACC2TRE6_9FUNG|nr:DNA-directed RNA polymerase I core subunit rpa12, variant 2 [Entomophthora muscae]